MALTVVVPRPLWVRLLCIQKLISPRSLAGKPLAGFRATPSRRIPVLYGIVVYAIRLKKQLLHLQSTL